MDIYDTSTVVVPDNVWGSARLVLSSLKIIGDLLITGVLTVATELVVNGLSFFYGITKFYNSTTVINSVFTIENQVIPGMDENGAFNVGDDVYSTFDGDAEFNGTATFYGDVNIVICPRSPYCGNEAAGKFKIMWWWDGNKMQDYKIVDPNIFCTK